MDGLRRYCPNDNPEDKDNLRPRLQVIHTVPAGTVRPLARFERLENTLTALSHVLATVLDGQAGSFEADVFALANVMGNYLTALDSLIRQ
jgi:hypothetical protein